MPDNPKAGETKEHYMEYCVKELYPSEYDQRQAVAVCINMWEGKSVEAKKKDTLNRVAEKINKIK